MPAIAARRRRALGLREPLRTVVGIDDGGERAGDVVMSLRASCSACDEHARCGDVKRGRATLMPMSMTMMIMTGAARGDRSIPQCKL